MLFRSTEHGSQRRQQTDGKKQRTANAEIPESPAENRCDDLISSDGRVELVDDPEGNGDEEADSAKTMSSASIPLIGSTYTMERGMIKYGRPGPYMDCKNGVSVVSRRASVE